MFDVDGTKQLTQADHDFYNAEMYGEDALSICCRCQLETETLGIDIEFQTYEALLVLVRGGTLAEAVACINLEHPFARKVVAELHLVARRLAVDRWRKQACFIA